MEVVYFVLIFVGYFIIGFVFAGLIRFYERKYTDNRSSVSDDYDQIIFLWPVFLVAFFLYFTIKWIVVKFMDRRKKKNEKIKLG